MSSSSTGAEVPVTTPNKKRQRETSQRAVERGVDRLLESAEKATRKYINETLDWLREIEKAVSRRQHHTVTQILGPKLAFRKDGFKLKHFTRRFFKLYIFKVKANNTCAARCIFRVGFYVWSFVWFYVYAASCHDSTGK